MANLFKGLIALSILFFSYKMFALSVVYLVPPFHTDIDFLLTKQAQLNISWWRYAFYIHISTSLLTLLSGLTQFSKTIYTKFSSVHRFVGKIYVGCVLFLSAPSGLILAVYANGGIIAQTGFVLLALLWFYTTLQAYRAAVAKDFERHFRFMLRSYALTFSAVTLRLLQFLFGYFGFFDYETAYRLSAYLGFLLNLGVAELLLYAGLAKYYFKNSKIKTKFIIK